MAIFRWGHLDGRDLDQMGGGGFSRFRGCVDVPLPPTYNYLPRSDSHSAGMRYSAGGG